MTPPDRDTGTPAGGAGSNAQTGMSVPRAASHRDTGIPAGDSGSNAQTGMSVPRAASRRDTGIPAGDSCSNAQTGMSVSLTHVSRRNLPHWRRDGCVYWVTFRLADSIQTRPAPL